MRDGNSITENKGPDAQEDYTPVDPALDDRDDGRSEQQSLDVEDEGTEGPGGGDTMKEALDEFLAALAATAGDKRSADVEGFTPSAFKDLQEAYNAGVRDGRIGLVREIQPAIYAMAVTMETTEPAPAKVSLPDHLAWIRPGARADYHGIINGPVSSPDMEVLEEPYKLGSQLVTRLKGKAGVVNILALSPAGKE